jgi:cytochrome P450
MNAATDRYADVDWFTDLSVVPDPYPYYRFLRDERGPVWIEPTYRVAVVTGHDAALAVYRDHERFSNCNAPSGPFPGLPARPDGDDANPLIDEHRERMPMYGYMATWDPPQHTDYRSLLTGLFTPKRLKENEDFMWRLADRQLDEFVERGSCEFVREFAEPFTALVIADLLGVPDEDRARFRAWFQAQKSPGRVDEQVEQSHDTNSLSFFESTFSGYVEDRRAAPRDDVLTHLAQVTFPDGSAPPVSVLANEAAFLFAAGQETTARSLAFALQHLGDHPQEQEHLRARRDAIPTFVEEIFRLESPVKSHFRLARRTTTLDGVEIPAGTTVMLLIGAINRDPARFDAADQLELDRSSIYEHVAFARGVHTCLGQQLARAEMRIAIERILDRMHDIRVDDAEHGPPDARRYDHDPTFFFRGLRFLHLTFTPV